MPNFCSFDGQYFDLGVDKKLVNLCPEADYEFFIPIWNIAHRIELAVKDLKDFKKSYRLIILK